MFVYVIQQGPDGPIKLGCAVDPGARLASMQSGNPDKLALLGVCRGNRGVERMLLTTFIRHRIRGEWFSPAREILDFAETLPSWESVKSGGDCPAIRTPAEKAQYLREAGYTHQEIGDWMNVSRQRAQQLAGSSFVSTQGKQTLTPLLEDGPNWLGEDRPPIADYVQMHPELFETTLLLEGDL